MKHQGQYPVIHLTFKGLKVNNYHELYLTLGVILSKLYEEHQIVYSTLSASNKKRFQAILEGIANIATLKFSLKNLTEYLHDYYDMKPYLLIDEYDTPILSAYLNHYYDQAIDLIRGLLSEALKGNSDLEKTVLTGILRVAKEGMFSGLNNIRIYSILNPQYSEYFGFTQAEVDRLLETSGFSAAEEAVRVWYHGYQMGDQRIYNPWSIIYYLAEQGICRAYWLNTSDNQWMQELLIRSNINMKKGQTIEVKLPDHFLFTDLERDDAILWSLLVMSGYLTAIPLEYIPNNEKVNQGSLWYDAFMEHLLSGNIEAWAQQLQEVMLQIVSYHDPARHPEAFYHGLLLGILAYLHQRRYVIKSNRESGEGQYDIAIIPQGLKKLGIVLELKQLPISHVLETTEIQEKLSSAAATALAHMELKRYGTELQQAGISNICQIAVAFCGKQFQLQYITNKACNVL